MVITFGFQGMSEVFDKMSYCWLLERILMHGVALKAQKILDVMSADDGLQGRGAVYYRRLHIRLP
jgi:hypothetical protein